MSPEAVEYPDRVDARSDLYSVGAVGYFLLTGETLFQCLSLGEVLMHQVKHLPDRPSARLGRAVSADLEDLLMRCLAKDPAARPATARDLEDALGRCREAAAWTRDSAEAWWRAFASARAGRTMATAPAPAAKPNAADDPA
jgi:eukaryotic-like serine/threonine-protein kinase